MRTLKKRVQKMTGFFRGPKAKRAEREEQRFSRLNFIRPYIERLEDRTLLSGNTALSPFSAPLSRLSDGASEMAAVNVVPLSSYPSFVHNESAPAQLVIADAAVRDYAALLNGIGGSYAALSALPPASANGDFSAGPMFQVSRHGDTEAVVLDSGYDGVQQISAILQALHGLNAVQVLSHGSPGELLLGNTVLDQRVLQQDQAQIASWGKALQPGGDILLYGCDVAQGTGGARFVQNLALMTGAEVAAHTQLTGDAALGGNWNLDYRTGPIEAQPAFTAAADSSYAGLLGVTTDLKGYIEDLLSSESASFTHTETINNVSLGGFLQMDTLTLTESATLSPGGVWSGTVGLATPAATLFPGHSFTAAITSLTGTFTIGSTGTDFTLSADNLTVNVGEALSITATGVDFTYASAGSDSQMLVTVQDATASSAQFTSIGPATLSNLAIRQDGFSFDHFTMTSAASSIGDFITTSDLTVSASDFNVTFGTAGNPTPKVTGTIGVTIDGLQLFPTGNLVQLKTTQVTATYDFGNFDGTDPSGALKVTISGFELDLGQALEIKTAGNVVITPGQETLVTIDSVTLSSPLLTQLGTVTAHDLEIRQDGFSLGSLQWGTASPVSIGGNILTLGSVEVDVNNFAIAYGATPSATGRFPLLATTLPFSPTCLCST